MYCPSSLPSLLTPPCSSSDLITLALSVWEKVADVKEMGAFLMMLSCQTVTWIMRFNLKNKDSLARALGSRSGWATGWNAITIYIQFWLCSGIVYTYQLLPQTLTLATANLANVLYVICTIWFNIDCWLLFDYSYFFIFLCVCTIQSPWMHRI